MKKIIFCN